MQVQKIDISLDHISRRFRWKSDLKPSISASSARKPVISHGNYLCGKINLPKNLPLSQYKLELCLVPSSNSDGNIYKTHPYLLHLTHPETYCSVNDITKESWKIVFDIDFQHRLILKTHEDHSLILNFNPQSPVVTLGKFFSGIIFKKINWILFVQL